jgi:hypothetical protein
MRCPNCGNEIGPAQRFCSRCGAPRPQLPSHLAEAETRFEALRTRLQAGQIDRASFEAQRGALSVRGPDGSYWSPGGDGRWYWYNGTAWVEREPPTEASGPPAPYPSAREPKPRGKRRLWLWVGLGGAAVVIVLAAALAIVLRHGPTWLAQDVPPTPTTASATVAPAPASASGEPSIYVATFDQDAPTLFSSQTGPGGGAAVENGRFCLQVSQADHTVVSSWESAPPNVSFDVDAAAVDGAAGTGYGVSVRGIDGNAGGALLFEINGQAQWRLRHKRSGAEYAELQAWTDSPAIEGGGATNLISVLVEGSQATFLVNGEEMASTGQAPTAGTVVGLVVSTPAGQSSGKACFDLFRARETLDTPVDDRQTVVAELGLPQTFRIAFGWDENGVPVRYETWTYFDYLTDFAFVDGTLVESEALEPVDELLVAPTWYSPFDFAGDMTLEQVEALLGEGELAQVSVPPELGADMALHAGEQVVLGFAAGKLEYVETLALGAIEEAE